MSLNKFLQSELVNAALKAGQNLTELAVESIAEARSEFKTTVHEAGEELTEMRRIAREELAAAAGEFKQALAEMRDDTRKLAREYSQGSQDAYEKIRAASRVGVVSCNRLGTTYALIEGAEKSVAVETLFDMHIKRGTPVFVVRTADGADVACPTTAKREKIEWLIAGIFNLSRGV